MSAGGSRTEGGRAASASRAAAADAPRLPPFPARDPEGHKGVFGTVCVVGGQAAPPAVMLGGPAFAARAALRTGCGLVVLAMPEPLLAAGLTVAPSATGLALPCRKDGRLAAAAAAEAIDQHLRPAQCLALGPGLGAELPQQQFTMRLVAQEEIPLVVDADALNCLAHTRAFHLDFRARAILTPHPGEFARLAAALAIDADPVDPAQRPAAAESLAQRLGCVVVLKGAGTVVSDGLRTWVSSAGNAALATAGSGDVLTGVIAGLVAQFHRGDASARLYALAAAKAGRPAPPSLDLFDCARLGVELHGRAAERWSARIAAAAGAAAGAAGAGLLADELCDELPATIAAWRSGRLHSAP